MKALRRRLRKTAREILHAPAPREIAFAILLCVVVLIYVPLRLTFGGALAPVVDSAPATESALAAANKALDPHGVLSLPTPPFVNLLSPHREIERNLFAYKTPTPTPPPPPPPPTPTPPPPPPPPTPPPPTPIPYTTPLVLFGLAESNLQRIAFLKTDEGLYYGVTGDLLTVKDKSGKISKHRVLDVAIDAVKIGPETGSGEVILKLKAPDKK